MTRNQANELLIACQALVTVYAEDIDEGELPDALDALIAEVQILVEEIEIGEDEGDDE
jgi:hypothetical protein